MSAETEINETVNVRLTAKGRDGLLAEAGRLQARDGRRWTIPEALEAVLVELSELRVATGTEGR